MDRREYITKIGAVVSAFTLAGCTFNVDSGNSEAQSTQPTQSTRSTQATTEETSRTTEPTTTATDSRTETHTATATRTRRETQTQTQTATRTRRPTRTRTRRATRTRTRTRTRTATRRQTTSPTATPGQEVAAEIVVFDPVTGEFSVGETQTATVILRNTGSARHTLYIGYSVIDPDGEGRFNGGGPASITLRPGEQGSVTVDWRVESSAPEGSYGAVTTVRADWDGEDFGETLDRAEVPTAFEVVSADSTSSLLGSLRSLRYR